MRTNLITRLKEEWNNLDPVDPLRGLIADAIDALAEQPAQQQEPVAWMWRCKPYCNWPEWSVSLKRPADSGRDGHKRTEGYEDVPLYTSPPASKPLTDEQIETAFKAWHYKHGNNTQGIKWVDDLLRSCWKAAIEAAHAKGEA